LSVISKCVHDWIRSGTMRSENEYIEKTGKCVCVWFGFCGLAAMCGFGFNESILNIIIHYSLMRFY
jgi:transposase